MSAKQKFFAVASVSKQRWYWVVWPSLEMVRTGQATQHLADGYESSKTEAVDQALNVAGLHGEWVAAKYAKQYHRQMVRQRQEGEEAGAFAAAPAVMEFLYRDIQDPATKQWYSVRCRIVKKTAKYIYVEQQPYDPARVSGGWLDHNAPTFRLSRAMLEKEGYALAPVAEIDDPLFFINPYPERLKQFAGETPACLELLNLTFPCSAAEVKAAYRKLVKQVHPDHGGSAEDFRALQAAYEQALRLCRYAA